MTRLLTALLVVSLVLSGGPVAAVDAGALRVDSRPRAASAVVRESWSWPVAGEPVVARGYQAPATRYGSGHRGIDLEVGVGAQALAPADGMIAFAGQVAGRPVIALDHGDGYRSSVEPATTTLAVGTRVVRGQPIGVVSDGGHCAGCLHFGVRLHGEYLDPRALITGIPRAILLPAA